MKQNLIGTAGTSFEPLLEKYIGRKVILEMQKDEIICEYTGILKDYSAEFIEIMDIDYKIKDTDPSRKADLVMPRRLGVVRHLLYCLLFSTNFSGVEPKFMISDLRFACLRYFVLLRR